MPTFIRKNPAELRGDLKANKELSKRLLKANLKTGIIGTPKGDADKFNNIVRMLEDTETSIEAYIMVIQNAVNDEFPGEQIVRERPQQKLLKELNVLVRVTGKSSFTLSKLPLTDVQTIRDYATSYGNYADRIDDTLIAEIDNLANVGEDPNDDGDPARGVPHQVSGNLRNALDDISKKLIQISKNLTLKVSVYDSGVAQPTAELVGSGYRSNSPCRCFTYNLDEPLKNNPAYQTQKYIF